MRFSPVSYLANQWTTNLPEGVIFYYDAGNPACYSGTGATIYDLSGNNWNATAPYGNANWGWNGTTNGGYFESAGNVGVSITGATLNQTLTNWTMYCSLYYFSVSSGGYDGFMFSRRGASNANGLGTFSTTRRLNLLANNGTEYTAPSTGSQLVPTSQWSLISGGVTNLTYMRQIGQTPSGTFVQNYQSGSKTSGSSIFDKAIVIGQDSETGDRTTAGRFGVMLMWNRQLSQAELTQVNNVFKGRYGL